MKNKVQAFRSQMQMTQTELSEKSGLSLRTIQRIESGTIPKGYTLKSIANALNVEVAELVADQNQTVDDLNIDRIKKINLSALTFIIIPFGNIIFPAWLMRGATNLTRKAAIDILGIQVVWTLICSVLLVISPAVQVTLNTKFPILFLVLFIMFSLNAVIIFKNAISLDKNGQLSIFLNFRFL